MKKLGVFLTISSLVILSLSAVVFNQAYAQTPTPNPPGGFRPRGGWGHAKSGGFQGVLQDYSVKALAEALGMTVEDIQARLKAGEKMLDIAKSKGWTLQDFQTKMPDIMSKALDLAVADGKITKEQADLMRQRQQNRANGDWGKRGKQGSMLGGTGPMHDLMEQAMAQVLGITPEDLSKRLSGGEKPAKIAQDKGINLQDFRTKLADAATQLINQAVKDSKLTQTQADWFLQMIQRMQGKFDGSGRCPNGYCGSGTPVPVLTPNL